MNYDILLDTAVELGYLLAMSGAETFRIEDSINRILSAYGIEAETFAIPNYLLVSIQRCDGSPLTKMRRIGTHGNDLDAVEKYNDLCRRICVEKPDPEEAAAWLRAAGAKKREYSLLIYLLGNFLGALGFAILFGGSFADCLCSGICGLIVGIFNRWFETLKANPFFRIIAVSFLMATPAYLFAAIGLADSADAVIIGALMILVPGLLFTNAMRDIIYGDTNSGLNRIVQVFLIAVAIALGTGAAWSFSGALWGIPATAVPLAHPLWLEAIACMVSCIGFFIVFNIHGIGGFLCALGGVITWICYSVALKLGCTEIMAYFLGTVTASVYSEIMARLRKCPAISYLVISAFPLIPGAGVYYTMTYAVRGEMERFATQGMYTVSIAGVMAVGILLSSTLIRLFLSARQTGRINK